MDEDKVFYGSIKTQRSFKSKGGGLVIQIEVSDKGLASWVATQEDADFKFTLTPGKDPARVAAEDPAQMKFPEE